HRGRPVGPAAGPRRGARHRAGGGGPDGRPAGSDPAGNRPVMISAELRSRVTAWIADDPDERDRAELELLLQAADREPAGATGLGGPGGPGSAAAELADRFAAGLEFGTAGL